MTPPTVECPECSLWECSCPEDDQPCVYYSKCSTCGGTGEVAPTNMYKCTPCPKCGGHHRFPTQRGTIQCDDCGFSEKGNPYHGGCP